MSEAYRKQLTSLFTAQRQEDSLDLAVQVRRILEAACVENNDEAIIAVMEVVVQCFGRVDLISFLPLFLERISKTAVVSEFEQNRLLRVINFILRRLNSTTDCSIRGQLQLALCTFLPLFHDSGFQSRAQQCPLPEEHSFLDMDFLWKQDNLRTQSLLSPMPPEFCTKFWAMEENLLHPQQLMDRVKIEGAHLLEKMVDAAKQVTAFFDSNEANEQSSFGMCFFKAKGLLHFQLRDPQFRSVIAFQLIICSRVLLKGGDVEKQFAEQLAQIGKKQLQKQGIYSEQGGLQLEEIIKSDDKWAEVKEGWKEFRKTYFKRCRPQKSNDDRSQDVSSVQKINFRSLVARQIKEKLKVNGQKMHQFLQQKSMLQLSEQPTTPSFSYFYEEAKSCYDSFDRVGGKQTAFESRNDYNMFEWKAMRSLYRQSLQHRQLPTPDPSSSIRNYRLLAILDKIEPRLAVPESETNIK